MSADHTGMDTWQACWEAALTELELDVDAAERVLTSAHLPPGRREWVPPTGLGPLPAPLRDRAQALLARQTEVARQITEAALMARRHARAAQALRTTDEAAPVYVDVAG